MSDPDYRVGTVWRNYRAFKVQEPVPHDEDVLLMEDGYALLLENDGKIIID